MRIFKIMHCGGVLMALALVSASTPIEDPNQAAAGLPAFGHGVNPEALAAVRPHAGQTPYDHGDPTGYEQYMLELINAARSAPGNEALRLGIDLNEGLSLGLILDIPKPPLAFNRNLIDAARAHSQWMLDRDLFQHEGENGNIPGDRMEAANYVFSGSWSWGENIAWGGETGPVNLKPHTVDRHEGLFLSPPHRTNLMDPGFDEIGVGILTGKFHFEGRDWNSSMATQNFARSASTPGPMTLGVVYRDLNSNGAYDPGEGVPDVTVRPGRGGFFAVTSASGGYAFPCEETGAVQVTISGGGLTRTRTKTIELDGDNVKLDWDLSESESQPVRIFFTNLSVMQNGMVRFDLECDSNVTATILKSEDLIQWKEVETLNLNEGTTRFTDQNPASQNRGFYRLIRTP